MPVSPITLLVYVVFLARTLKPTSINQYLNVVRLMHMERGLPNPLDDWNLHNVQRGIARLKGEPPKQKLPITIEILKLIYNILKPVSGRELAFWAACVVAFFAFLRKSTLLPLSQFANPELTLCIKDVKLQENQLLLSIRHTKTIQFGQRVLRVPLCSIPGSPLCPVKSVSDLLHHTSHLKNAGKLPLFSYITNGQIKTLTHTTFVAMLKSTLSKANIDVSLYSGHSFRRGGCSYAFQLGLPPLLIKLRGDWKSNAYERYVTINETLHTQMAGILSLAAS